MTLLKNTPNFLELCEKWNVDSYRIISVDSWLSGEDKCAPTFKACHDWLTFYIKYWSDGGVTDEFRQVTEVLLSRV